MSLAAEGVSGKKRRRSADVDKHDNEEADDNGLTVADKLDLKVLSKLPAVQSGCFELNRSAEPGHLSQATFMYTVLRDNSDPC